VLRHPQWLCAPLEPKRPDAVTPREPAEGISLKGDSLKRICTMSLLKWALIFLLISIVAAVFGFTGISAASADIARVLFYIFVVIFVVLLILGLVVARRV
jgi:uncharacterized membrane protein YtjA (UPF0391 family)